MLVCSKDNVLAKSDVYAQLAALTQDFHQEVKRLLKELEESMDTPDDTRQKIEGLRKQAISTGIVKCAWDIADFLIFFRDERRLVLFDRSVVALSLTERKSRLDYSVSIKRDDSEFVVQSEKKKRWLPDESVDYVELSIMHGQRCVLALTADVQYRDEIRRSGTSVLGYIPGAWEAVFRELAIGIEVTRAETEAARRKQSDDKRLEEDQRRFGLDE